MSIQLALKSAKIPQNKGSPFLLPRLHWQEATAISICNPDGINAVSICREGDVHRQQLGGGRRVCISGLAVAFGGTVSSW